MLMLIKWNDPAAPKKDFFLINYPGFEPPTIKPNLSSAHGAAVPQASDVSDPCIFCPAWSLGIIHVY